MPVRPHTTPKPMPVKSRITPQQKELVRRYLTSTNFNQRAAALQAGYSPSMAASIKRVFDKPQVQAEIQRIQNRMEKRFEVTYDKLVEELAKIAFFNLTDVMSFNEDTGELEGINLDRASLDAIAALGEVKVETMPGGDKRVTVKPYNKMDAIEKLMKHTGASKEVTKHEHTHSLADRLRDGRSRMNKRLEQNPPIDAEFEEIDG